MSSTGQTLDWRFEQRLFEPGHPEFDDEEIAGHLQRDVAIGRMPRDPSGSGARQRRVAGRARQPSQAVDARRFRGGEAFGHERAVAEAGVGA